MARDSSTPEEMAASRKARVAARELERQERYLAFLRLAIRVRLDRSLPADELKQNLQSGEDELKVLTKRAGGRIVGRRRPKKTDCEPCVIYIDECGSHSLKAKEPYEAFVLAAVIVRESEAEEMDRRCKSWKAAKLGVAEKIIHEPDFTTVACVMNRPAYRAEFRGMSPDESLPEHPYLVH